MKVNDVVQFNENHKWRGSFGFIREIKEYKLGTPEKEGKDIRYMVGVPIPEKGTAFIFIMESENVIEYIGEAKLILKSEENE